MPRWIGVVLATRSGDIALIRSDLFDFWPAEDAGRQEDQHDGQDRKGCDILVVDGEIRRPHALDEADEQAAEYGTRDRADAAEHRRREGLHAGHEAVGEGHDA